MYLHRVTPRALLAAQIILWNALTQLCATSAAVTVNVQLADQLPPLAHVKQHYDWQFLAETFTSSSGGDLSYSIQGLPDWATFDERQLRIPGDPTKSIRGDESHEVQVTAKDGSDEASSSFQLITISAPAPSLKTSLKDQLPEAASMGLGNMLPNKVLHMPLGWSFSVGFDGDTFVLPEDDRVYYSTYLEGARPLPEWLVFNEEEMTYSGIAPTDAGPNGTMFDIVLFASNRRNSGGPSSSFQIFLGNGVITLNNTAAALPVANVTEGDTLQYHIPPELFLLDGFSRKQEQFSFALGDEAPSWVSFDPASNNLTGKAPFNAKNKDIQNSTFPLLISYPNARNTSVNLTLSVYPSPFTQVNLPNVTVQSGKDFKISMNSYLRDDSVSLNVSFGNLLQRRSLRFMDTGPHHRILRRAMPDWVHYESSSHSLVGTAPPNPQQVSVNLIAANPVPQTTIPNISRSFELIVKNATKTNTTQSSGSGGLTGADKGAIAGSILGAAFLALLASLLFCCLKRHRSSNQTQAMSDVENQGEDVTSLENKPLEPTEGVQPSTNTPTFDGATGAGLAGVGAAGDAVSGRTTGLSGQAATGTFKRPAASANNSAAASSSKQPYQSGRKVDAANLNDKAASQDGVTQILPVDEPEWRRDNDQVVLTPFLSQSAWQPPLWTQMTSSMQEGRGNARPGAGSPFATFSTMSPHSEDAHYTMAHDHVDEPQDSKNVTEAPFKPSSDIKALIKAPVSQTSEESKPRHSMVPPETETLASSLKPRSTVHRTAKSVPPTTVTEAEPEEKVTEFSKWKDVPKNPTPAEPPVIAGETSRSRDASLPKPASFLAGFVDRSRTSYGPHKMSEKSKPALNGPVGEKLNRPEQKDIDGGDTADLPASVSKSSKASWEDNLWYEPVSKQDGSSVPPQGFRENEPKLQQRVPTDRATFLSAFSISKNAASRPNSHGSDMRAETPLGDSMWSVQLNEDQEMPSRTAMPSIISKTSARVDESKLQAGNGVTLDSAPQLDPIAANTVTSPLVPGIGDPPTISTRVEPGLMSPMNEFVAPPTQPMDVKRTRKVASYTPKLESVPALQKSSSIHVEPKSYHDMFEDAEEPVVDPFAGEEYPYGTVLYQQHHQDVVTGNVKESDMETLEDFRTTEGGLATVMHLTEESDGRSQAPALLPRSGTMASIQLAEARSVNFTTAKPPRLQLASCHPGQVISLPLMTSDASLPRHLAEAIENASMPARYTPQLYAPSRPDLHQQWPGWLHWLVWDSENHELAGLVPPNFAESHRLPMQLPIHSLLENSEQIFSEDSGHAKHGENPMPPLLARILLTILPAVPSAENQV